MHIFLFYLLHFMMWTPLRLFRNYDDMFTLYTIVIDIVSLFVALFQEASLVQTYRVC